METKKSIYSRTSATSFSAEKLQSEEIKAIVEAGNYAPIFGSIHFTVIENAELIENIKNTTITFMKNSGNEFIMAKANDPSYDPLYNAPAMIVLSAQNGNDSNGFNMANVACAAENMLLMATDLGLGSRYIMAPVMAFSNPDIINEAQIPADYEPLCIVLIGHTDAEFVERNKENNNINYVR